jgi:hypothetical protein
VIGLKLPGVMATNDAPDTATDQAADRGRALTPRKAASILWDCAWEALILAFLVQVLGSVAVAMVGNVWGSMTPSLPPGLAGEQALEASPAPPAFHLSSRERFGLIFAVVFIPIATGRLMRYSRNPERRNAAAWLQRVTRRVSEEWFSVVVLNAFIASIMVSVLQVTSQFTPLKMFWQFLVTLLHPLIHEVLSLLPAGPAGMVQGLADWYDANQLKFSFWLLYSAAICDDLGLPNYKALGRWIRRRWTTNNQPAAASVKTPPEPQRFNGGGTNTGQVQLGDESGTGPIGIGPVPFSVRTNMTGAQSGSLIRSSSSDPRTRL